MKALFPELKVRNDTTTYYDFMGHQHLNVIVKNVVRIADMDLDLSTFSREAAEADWLSKSPKRVRWSFMAFVQVHLEEQVAS